MKTLIITMATAMATLLASGANKAVELLKEFEGFRPSVYVCAAGRKTIGYGFTSDAWVSRKSITAMEAETELKRLADEISLKLHKELDGHIILTPNEEAALISFIYNVGWGAFKASTMCRLLKEGKRGAVVGVEFHKWVYVNASKGKTICKGLKDRRYKEAMCFLCG